MTRPLILLTNDDGIDSPGLAAAAAALHTLGDLLIVAPTAQQSGMGRSMPGKSTGRLYRTNTCADGITWPAFGAEASPAQAVQHGLLELADRHPALAVSGINYGENIGTGITISGTVGAALEAAEHGIPALAVSLEVGANFHRTNEDSVDFSTAMFFTRLFAERWLKAGDLPDVDVLKIDIPAKATPQTPWRITRLERGVYYRPLAPDRTRLEDAGVLGYEIAPGESLHRDSDASAITEGVVSVTPISLDMTSRIEAERLRQALEDV